MDRSMEDRLWERISPEPNSGCWLWIGACDKDGYAVLKLNGREHKAHRVAYETCAGSIPHGLEIDHICRVRCCVNPAHLEPVTHAENMRRSDSGKYLAAKTHCPKGHPYSGENLYVRPEGWRECRACRRTRW